MPQYYNPTDNEDNYYSPQQNTQNNASADYGPMLRTMGMAIGLNLVGAVATKHIIGAGKNTLRSWAKNSESVVRRNLAEKTIATYSSFKKAVSPFTKSITESSIYKAGQERKAALALLKDKPGYGLARVTSAFKNTKTLLATTAGVWKSQVLSGLAVAYGVDNLLGFTREMGLEKKKIYDIPGKISNFAKWMGYSTVGGLAMGAGLPIAGAIGSAGFKAVQKTFHGDFGKKVLGWAAQFANTNANQQFKGMVSQQENKFVAGAVTKGLHFAQNLGEMKRGVQDSLYTIKDTYRTKGITFGSRTQKAFGVLKAAIRNANEISKKPPSKTVSSVRYSGISTASEIAKYAQKSAAEWRGKDKVDIGNSLDDFFSTSHIRHNKDSILTKIFGSVLKPIKVRDVVSTDFIKETFSNLKVKYTSKSATKLTRQFLNLNVGDNIYKDWRNPGIKGAMVDLNFLDPIHMMRRAIAPVLNYQVYAPFVKSTFSLADLTGTHKWISERPDMFATTHKPDFKFDGPEAGAYSSVGEVAQNNDALFIYTKGGKWAVFDGGVTKTITTDRNLYYSHKSGADKQAELKDITINRIKKLKTFGMMAKYNAQKDKLDHGEFGKNKFFDIFGLEFPKKLKEHWKDYRNKVDGRGGRASEFENFFIGPVNDAGGAVPLINNIYGHTTQILSRVSRNRESVQVMANHIHNTELRENLLAATLNDQGLMDKISQLPLNARFFNSTDTIRAVENIKAFPEQARNHSSVKRLGMFSAMTDIDDARVSYVDDIFHTIIKDNAEPHPLLTVAPELYQKGIISRNEKDALLLHGKIASFQQDGLIKGVTNNLDTFTEVLGKVRDRAKQNNWDITNELIQFTKNHDMRRPSILSNEERILQNKLERGKDLHPFVSSPNNAINALQEYATGILDRTTSFIGEYSPFKKYYMSNHGFTGNLKYLGRSAGITAMAFGAYRILDTVTAANPLFDDTMLEDGVTGALADSAAKARFGMSRVSDTLGVTSTMKYLHGLAPYSETSLPGAFVGAVYGMMSKASVPGIVLSSAYGALANRMAAPILPDMTKSYEELREIYAGREDVPIMKAPMWLLGGTPWEGSKVVGYSPNWYVQAKSRWKETNTMYGSAFRKLIHEPLPLIGFNVGDLVDPYYMERKHFFSRPYPITGGIFDEVPFIGKTLSATVGKLIKPQKTMHQEYLTRGMNDAGSVGDPYPFAIRPPTVGENLFHMNPGDSIGTSNTGQANNFGKITLMNNKYWAETAGEDFLYDIQQFAGLKGFLAGSIAERIFNTNKVVPTLQTAGRIASFSRSYSDLNLGGMGILSEPLRRVIEKPEYRQYGLNPIPNMLPNWLPSQFLTGDPYEKIMRGELRLPGDAYLSTHDNVKKSMPARASMLGGTLENIVQYFTGLISPTLMEDFEIMETGTEFHQKIQNTLASEGMLIQAEALVNDVKHDITGHVDAIIRDGIGGKGRRALEIKTINDNAFQKLDAPKDQHFGQLNFYLRELGLRKGTLLYVNRDNPSQVKTFEINYSQNRWNKDIRKLQKARTVAKTMMEEGVGDTLGYSYSWTDRMRILADVAPNSLEYKEAKQIVDQQIKFGMLDKSEQDKYRQSLRIKQTRIRSYELYPNRFKGKVLHPDSVSDIQSINEDIKAGAEYSLPERAVGALWERFTNTNTFLINKFFAAKDPLEHYKMTRLYGKEYKPWDEPIRGWIDPMVRNMASKTGPLGGAISFGFGGMIFGGGPLAGIVGAGVGALYGTGHGLYRAMTGTTYIPESVKEKREIVSYFDAAKYERNNMLASLSQGLTQKEFMQQRDATLTAFNQGGKGVTVANLFRGTSGFEKPYIESWLNTRNPEERQKILSYVPDDLASALKHTWSMNDNKEGTAEYNKNNSNELASGNQKYKFNRSIMDPSINLEDIKLKTINEAGFDHFEFGLGWNEQMLRIQESTNNIQAAKIERLIPSSQSMGPNVSQSNVRGMINDLFSKSGIKSSVQIYIDNTMETNQIEIIIKRDRSRTIVNALNKRKKYRIE